MHSCDFMSHTNDFVIITVFLYLTIVTILTTVTFYLQKMLKESNILYFPILSLFFLLLEVESGFH